METVVSNDEGPSYCLCGHSESMHCYYQSGDCAGRNCGCERYIPMSERQQKVRAFVESVGLPDRLADKLEKEILDLIESAERERD